MATHLSLFWKWLTEVLDHWEIIVATGAIPLLLDLIDRFFDWKMPKKMYLVFIIIGLILAMFSAWRDQYLKTEAAEKRLQELTHPNFDISHGTIATVEFSVHNADKTIDRLAALVVPITVVNLGAPSVIKGFWCIAKLTTGEEVAGDMALPPGDLITLKDAHENLIPYKTSSSLFIKGTAAPIATGSQADGFIWFQFPGTYYSQLNKPGTTFKLEFGDVTGKRWPHIIEMTGKEAPRVQVSPGMR